MSAAKTPFTYKEAGVDIDAKMNFIEGLKAKVKSTHRKGVIGGIGGFGGLFGVKECGYKDPVLVTSIDGVGTKIKVAVLMGKHDTVGMDIVSHGANDIAVQGAEPLYVFDYIGTGKLSRQVADQIVEGLVEGCKLVGCALLGGETAEMPGVYPDGEYDLVATIVGMVEREKLIDGSKIKAGDALVSFASTGLHTNGYSLARRVLLDSGKYSVGSRVAELGETVGEALLRPHKAYSKEILQLMKKFEIHGMAHITGGGFYDNIPRILPKKTKAVIKKGTWTVPPIFRLIQKEGNIDEREMHHVFNMGVGMVVAVRADQCAAFLAAANGLKLDARPIGEVQPGNQEVDIL